MIPLVEKMYRAYLRIPIPNDWEGNESVKPIIRQYEISEKRSAKVREFCMGEGCTIEDMKNCGQFNSPCARCAAFIMKLDKEKKK